MIFVFRPGLSFTHETSVCHKNAGLLKNRNLVILPKDLNLHNLKKEDDDTPHWLAMITKQSNMILCRFGSWHMPLLPERVKPLSVECPAYMKLWCPNSHEALCTCSTASSTYQLLEGFLLLANEHAWTQVVKRANMYGHLNRLLSSTAAQRQAISGNYQHFKASCEPVKVSEPPSAMLLASMKKTLVVQNAFGRVVQRRYNSY